MNIKEAFHAALCPSRTTPQNTEYLLGTCALYPSTEDTSGFIAPLAGGYFASKTAFSYEFYQLDCYILIYTASGSGKLFLENASYALSPHTFVLFRGTLHYSISMVQPTWKFHLYYFSGDSLSSWQSFFSKDDSFYLDLTAFPLRDAVSPRLEHLEQLLHRQNETAPVIANHILTNLFTELVLWKTPRDCSGMPAHVRQLKDWCENHFQEHFSLDEAAERLKVSKYKICRDFSSYMHISPLQYLNQQRIAAAKELLAHTDACVYEIGNAVGIENTNHFINLFKKYAGTTPNEFRLLYHQESR